MDYKKVPEQIASMSACIAVWYLHSIYRLGLKGPGILQHGVPSVCVSFTSLERGQKGLVHTDSEYTGHAHRE